MFHGSACSRLCKEQMTKSQCMDSNKHLNSKQASGLSLNILAKFSYSYFQGSVKIERERLLERFSKKGCFVVHRNVFENLFRCIRRPQ